MDLKEAYLTPGHPLAFSSPGAIYRYLNGRVPLAKIQKILQSVKAYTHHREFRKPRVYNPFFAYRRRTRFQMDLIDIRALKKANAGICYLLCIICVFSRRLWVFPLKFKTAKATSEALETWLTQLKEEEKKSRRRRKTFLYCDKGLEFNNARVRQVLARFNVQMDFAQRGPNKAAVVERVQKSLQRILFSYLSSTGKTRYIDALSALVRTYNSAKHRTLQFLTPMQADDPNNETRVRSIHLDRIASVTQRAKRQRRPTLHVNDTVIVTVGRGKKIGKETRAYTPSFGEELFAIVSINRRMPVPMYRLVSLRTGQPLRGAFYAAEVTKVHPTWFKVERVLATRGGDEVEEEEKLVRWQLLHPVFDCWIPASAIQRGGWVLAKHLTRSLHPTHLPQS